MRVFVTGATGFIGSVVVDELLKARHQVLGLTRSDAGAKSLAAAGAEVHRGSLEDLESLRSGAAAADGVIHLAFNHDAFNNDFSKFVTNCETDRQVIDAIGSVLEGSDRPFVVTSGTGLANTVPGQPAREDNAVISSSVIPRAASEEAAASVAARGVNVSVVRLPPVHDPVKQGLVTYAVALAREKAFRRMLAMDSIAGRLRTSSILLICTGWRWRSRSQEPSTTQSLKKECHSATSRRSLAGG
jgi:nucleoside-diphosphate-sugar epimerase